jgi:hypothetical protein
VLRDGFDPSRLVRCEAGIRLRELNAWLDRRGLALSNMGGYDAQTIGGVMSTATHGSGCSFGPIVSFVLSIDIVASGGRLLRIERVGGPSDPDRFASRYAGWTLIQDDEWFNAVSVGLGAMGVLYAVLLDVEPKYWLKEVRTETTWTRIRSDLAARRTPRAHRHYELLFNPYPASDGDYRFLVTTRDRTAPTGAWDHRRWRHRLVEVIAAAPFVSTVLAWVMNVFPGWTPRLLDAGLRALVDTEYSDLSYRVLNIGTANLLRVYSAEIAVPCDDRGLHIQAVERVMEVAARHRALGTAYHTAPISLRFVARSPAHLAMMHGRDLTMMIELIILAGTRGGLELLAAYEEALAELGGRPHWGQCCVLAGGRDRVAELYPDLPRWLAIERLVNASGVFDSPFTRQIGLTS